VFDCRFSECRLSNAQSDCVIVQLFGIALVNELTLHCTVVCPSSVALWRTKWYYNFLSVDSLVSPPSEWDDIIVFTRDNYDVDRRLVRNDLIRQSLQTNLNIIVYYVLLYRFAIAWNVRTFYWDISISVSRDYL